MGNRVEAIFGGVLVIFVIVAAVIAVLSFPDKNAAMARKEAPKSASAALAGIGAGAESIVCQCYNGGFGLAGSDVDVMSSQYRTGYEQCRAIGNKPAANAWTDGWNARLSARPYETSCSAYRRRKGV